MKKLSLLMLTAVVMLSACKKDEKTEELQPTKTYTTVEEGKNAMQSSGMNVVTQAKAFKDLAAVDAAIQVADLMEQDDLFGGESESSTVKAPYFKKFLDLTKLYAENKISTRAFMQEMGNTKSGTQMEQDFLDGCGTYAWADTAWKTVVEGGDKFILQFPASETATTNNGEFTVSNFSATTINIDGEAAEVPVSLKASLKVDNAEIMSLDASATYSNDRPTSVSINYSLPPFSIVVDIKNTNNKSASASYTFKNGSTVILGFSAGASGDWNESNISANTYTNEEYYEYYVGYDPDTYEPIYETDTSYHDSVIVENIVTSANVSIQVFDVKLTGTADIKTLATKIRQLDQQENTTEQQYVDLANQYVNIKVVQVSTNLTIAKAEAYMVTGEPYTYYDYVWNDATQQYEEIEVTETDEWVDFRLVFEDGSKADLETYLKTGFDDLEADLNQFILDINEEFEAELDPIDFQNMGEEEERPVK